VSVKIITDSTADLPPEVAQEFGITVVPLHIHFGHETYKDGVDISKEEFYRRLTSEHELPKTSAPSAGAFTEAYERLAGETDEILSLHISHKLSATYNSATMGRDGVTADCRISVIDTLTTSMGLGLLAIRAARLAGKGATLDEVVADTESALLRTQFFGVLDTLEYLHKGGRLGKASSFLGSILQVKPIVGLRDGEVHPIERARGFQKALDRICEMVADYKQISSLAVAHTTGQEDMERMASQMSQFYPGDRILRSRVGSTIGTYLGPGALCVGLIEG